MKKFLLPISLLVTAILFTFLGFTLNRSLKVSPLAGIGLPGTVSDILFLTSPVNSFSGKVTKVEKDSIILTQKMMLPLPFNPPAHIAAGNPATTAPIPTPVSKDITFKVKIAPATQITRPVVSIPYLLISVTPPVPAKLTISDIKPGQMVSVTTNTDLRTLSGNEFEANFINLPSIINTLSGKITAIGDNIITLRAFPPVSMYDMQAQSAQPPKEEEYRVQITTDTEISRFGPPAPFKEGVMPKPAEPEKLSLSDLKSNQQVTVYTDVDVTAMKSFKALRIEPPAEMPPAPVPVSPILSPTPSIDLNDTFSPPPTTAPTTNSADIEK